MVTEMKQFKPKKAESSIFVTDAGTVIEVKSLQ
jgi:hypothetical protein